MLLAGELAVELGDSRPAAAELAEVMAGTAVRQLVILGEPGAGKTTLAVLYTLAVLEPPGTPVPVPVPVSVAGWDPGTDPGLRDWIAGQVSILHPSLTTGEARDLLTARAVIPVLDGLDEMPSALRGQAITALDAAAGAGLRTVVTCRTREFANTVGRRRPRCSVQQPQHPRCRPAPPAHPPPQDAACASGDRPGHRTAPRCPRGYHHRVSYRKLLR
jgi:hypothetical protein